MKRTVKVKVNPPKDIALRTLKTAKAIFDLHVSIGKEHGTWNKLKLHRLAYRTARDLYPNMPSSLVQTIRDTASEAMKRDKLRTTPTKRLRSGIRFNLRTFSLRGKRVSFSLAGMRWKEEVSVPTFQEPVWTKGVAKAATMTYDGHQFWLNVVFELPIPAKIEGHAVGIDRGMLNLAVTSDGLFFKSKKIRAAQRNALYTKRQLQSQGTRSAARRLTRVSRKEQRRTKDWNHVVSKRVAQLPFAVFILEDLSNIRERVCRRGKHFRTRFHRWPFRQFETFLSYKAEALGKAVTFVDARYTSQKCSSCKTIGERSGGRFSCANCGLRLHADLNAAKNIRDNYLSSLSSAKQASVNTPNAPRRGVSKPRGLSLR